MSTRCRDRALDPAAARRDRCRPCRTPRAARALAHPGLDALLAEIERSGLTGRGGAGFPTATKVRAVAAGRRRPVLVGNAMEGEPLSHKDAVLLARNPHLVLDGLEVLGRALRARRVVLAMGDHLGPTALSPGRGRARDRGRLPRRRLRRGTGDGPGQPARRAPRPTPRPLHAGHRVRGRRPAHARAERRDAGPGRSRGSVRRRLVPRRRHPRGPRHLAVHDQRLGSAGQASSRPSVALGSATCWQPLSRSARGAVLVGGYHGAWVPAADLDVRLTRPELARYGASVGAGVLHVLDDDSCPIAYAADVTDYLAGESARQCGPCLNGLPRLAADLAPARGRGPRPLAARRDRPDGRAGDRARRLRTPGRQRQVRRLDPATPSADTWPPTSTAGAPRRRGGPPRERPAARGLDAL